MKKAFPSRHTRFHMLIWIFLSFFLLFPLKIIRSISFCWNFILHFYYFYFLSRYSSRTPLFSFFFASQRFLPFPLLVFFLFRKFASFLTTRSTFEVAFFFSLLVLQHEFMIKLQYSIAIHIFDENNEHALE